MNKCRWRRISRAFLLYALLLLVVSCRSWNLSLFERQAEAPPITADLNAIAMRSGHTEQTLKLGREVFSTRCTECHELRTIPDYSEEEWLYDYLPLMARRARLQPAEHGALKVYIRTVLRLKQQQMHP